MNNKGQSLVLFVFLIPIFIMVFALIFDSAIIILENNKLKNLAVTSLNYLLEEDKSVPKVKEYIKKNDENIEKIDIKGNKITLLKHVEGYFGKIIGYENYELEVTYEGVFENGNLTIKKKG